MQQQEMHDAAAPALGTFQPAVVKVVRTAAPTTAEAGATAAPAGVRQLP